jgi:hypothetical protein
MLAKIDFTTDYKLDEKSILCQVIQQLRNDIRRLWPKCSTYADNPVRVEFSKRISSEKEIQQKASALQGKTLDLQNQQTWGWCGNQFNVYPDPSDIRIRCPILSFRTSATPDLVLLQQCVQRVVREVETTNKLI